MHQKKILIVYHGLRNIGGGEKSLLEFVEEIRLQNHEISLLYSNRNAVIESLNIYEAEIIEISNILNKYRITNSNFKRKIFLKINLINSLLHTI